MGRICSVAGEFTEACVDCIGYEGRHTVEHHNQRLHDKQFKGYPVHLS